MGQGRSKMPWKEGSAGIKGTEGNNNDGADHRRARACGTPDLLSFARGSASPSRPEPGAPGESDFFGALA